jgi:hypothetical protein
MPKAGSSWLCLNQTKCPNPKYFGGIYEKEFAEGAHSKPPKRKINPFGGILDIYTTVLFSQVFNCRMPRGNCLIQLRMSP